MLDLQKANVWKRISAALFDGIMLGIAIVGVAFLLSVLLGFDGYMEQKEALELKYMTEYGLDPDLTYEELESFSEEEKAAYTEKQNLANEAYGKDPETVYVHNMLFSLAMMIVSLSVLFGYLLWELAIPMLLKNGQTVGKKIFGVALMRVDGVRVSTSQMFIRTVLGKCTLGLLLPIYGIIMTFFGIAPLLGTVAFGGILFTQAILFIATRNHTPLHDLLSQTVAVDMASQLIFDSPEELLAYKKRIHAEAAEKSAY